MDKFESRLNTIEERTNEEVKNSISTMETEVIESLQSKIESLVDSRTKELEDRKRRGTNKVVFNVSEDHHPRSEENKNGDIDDIQKLSSSLGLENLQIKACFRLGRKKTTSNRPLKLVLEMKSQKKILLDNAKFVPDKTPMYLRQVIIVRDLTPTQRETEGRGEVEQEMQSQMQDPPHHQTQMSQIWTRAVLKPLALFFGKTLTILPWFI